MNTVFKRRQQEGQTMIIGVIAVLVLLVGIFFLFDIHSIVRVKVKTQTAADAAALTAANWQRHSLNLIGELNLVKACTVLSSDIDPVGDKPEDLTIKSEILTEMQARISFVGPMLGFGAAQQAAKNNGMNPVDHYTFVVRAHISNLENDDYYGDAAGITQEIENYSWRWPYKDMVESVLVGQGGIAAAPNVDYAALPQVDPAWLMDLGLYRAISSEYWCYGTLRTLIKSYSFSGPWWQATIIEDSSSFPEECEYSPIYVTYSSTGNTSIFDLAEEDLRVEAGERVLSVVDRYDKTDSRDTDGIDCPLPYVKWCTYETRWNSQISSEWTTTDEPYYMRQPLKSEYNYGGAVAKMTCRADPKVLSGNYNTACHFGDSVSSVKGAWVSNAAATDRTYVTCSALAKPLGKLSSGLPPNSVGMVLPVFDQSRLIPIAMQDPMGLYDPFNEDLYSLFEFLKWAADVSDIGEIGEAKDGCPNNYYLLCLQKLNDENWRSKGYNRNYVPSVPTTAYDSTANPDGAGWLQMAHRYATDASGNPTSVTETNEDTCDDWPSGGGGSRAGPSVLH